METKISKIKELIKLRDAGDSSIQQEIDQIFSALEADPEIKARAEKAEAEKCWINSRSTAMEG